VDWFRVSGLLIVGGIVGAGSFMLGTRHKDRPAVEASSRDGVRQPGTPVRSNRDAFVAVRPPEPSAVAQRAAVAETQAALPLERQPPWLQEERDIRATQAEEDIVRLREEVEREQIDAGWARSSERDIRAALAEIPGTEVVALRCASKRCSVEAIAPRGKASMDARRRITMMSGFARTRIRKERAETGTRFRTILARDGFTVDGEPDPTP
jgi:hypothetical protein